MESELLLYNKKEKTLDIHFAFSAMKHFQNIHHQQKLLQEKGKRITGKSCSVMHGNHISVMNNQY